MASLSLRHIYKIYQGGVKAVSDFNLEIEDKEFIVFVGPSGCGKSTTLRMVAGLEEISMGELYIDGRLVNDVEPKDRDIAMVFQNYALYPHMTVYDNMAFGLKLRKMPSAQIDQRVKEAANILGIEKLLTRKPKALSGGQRQRVALGRAIVREPKVFLLDEPLSNLDAKLRVQMRTEITKLHNKLATTFIYVTHDQTEAMTMGTRIVVMKDGLMQQVDTPQNLYDSPCNQFVASFIGTPQMNFFHAKLEKVARHLVVKFGKNTIELSESKSKKLVDESYIGKEVIFGVRPEDIHDEEIFINSSPKTMIEAEIDVMEKLGNETIFYTKVDGKEDYCVARVDARTTVKAGEVVTLAIDANHVHLFDVDTELTLLGLPVYNYFDATLSADGDSLVATVAGTKFKMEEGTVARLTNPDLIGKKVVVGVSPLGVALRGEGYTPDPDAEPKNEVETTGVVDFIEDNGAYKVVYLKVDGKKGFTAVKAPIDFAVKEGEKLKLAIDLDMIGLFDQETGDRLISYGSVPKMNVFETTIAPIVAKTGETILNVKFGGAAVKLPVTKRLAASAESGYLAVAPDAFVYTKEALAGKYTFKAMVENVDKIGDYTLVYASMREGARFVAKVDGNFSAVPKDNVKFGFDLNTVDLVNGDGKSLLVPEVAVDTAAAE